MTYTTEKQNMHAIRGNRRHSWYAGKMPFKRSPLVAHWLRIHLPIRETWVRFLIQEIPTCAEQLSWWGTAIEPELQGHGAAAAERTCSAADGHGPPSLVSTTREPPRSSRREARVPRLESSPCSPQLEKAHASMKTQHCQINKQMQLFKNGL